MNRSGILELAGKQGLLPPFHHTDAGTGCKILDAVYAGGLRIIEFTNRSATAPDVFSQLKKHVQQNLPGLILGSGTIMNADDAARYFDAGSEFMVSPIANAGLGEWCREHDCFWCPGAFTPGEIVQAHQSGADLVKLFPAEIAGPSFVKALRGPCPWLQIMPSGGVTLQEDNLRQWFSSGVYCVAIGSHLFDAEILEYNNYHLLQQRITWLLETIAEIRNDLNPLT